MPVATIKYLCQFKCGHRAMSKEKHMVMHEETCWSNPKLRTCKSCKHEDYKKIVERHDEIAGCPNETWMERGCLKINYDKFEELLKEYQPFQRKEQFYINPIVNCPHWESKSLNQKAK